MAPRRFAGNGVHKKGPPGIPGAFSVSIGEEPQLA